MLPTYPSKVHLTGSARGLVVRAQRGNSMARKSIFSFVVLALLVGIVTARPTSVADRSSEPTKFQQLHAEHFQRVSAIVE